MLVISAFCAFLEDSISSQRQKRNVFALALLPYFVLMAFKASSIGADTYGYFQSYAAMANYDFSNFLLMDDFGYERIEKGYKFYIWLLTRVSSDGQFLIIVTSAISTIALYSFIKDNAYNKSLALFFFITLGFFQFAMTGIRQLISISISLLGVRYIKEQKLLKYIIIIFLATQFHTSAVFFFPAYFIARMKTNRKNICLSIISIVVLYLVGNEVLFMAADILEYDYGIEQTGNGYIFFVLVMLITILSVISRNKLVSRRNENFILLNLNFISLATWTLRLISRTAERVSLYYMPFTYVLLEQYISLGGRNKKLLKYIIVIVLCSILFLRRISNQSELNHYKFFFS